MFFFQKFFQERKEGKGMKGKAAFTPASDNAMPSPPHQGLEWPLAPLPLHGKERGAKVSRLAQHAVRWCSPRGQGTLGKKKLCFPPMQVPCSALHLASPALSHAHAGFGFLFLDIFISWLRKGMVLKLQLQGRLPESGLIWPFLLLFLPSMVGSMVRVRMPMHPTY